jgi:hypothetical protein
MMDDSYPTTGKPTSIYVSAQDKKRGRSKTITVRGHDLTPEAILEILVRALKPRRRKAG